MAPVLLPEALATCVVRSQETEVASNPCAILWGHITQVLPGSELHSRLWGGQQVGLHQRAITACAWLCCLPFSPLLSPALVSCSGLSLPAWMPALHASSSLGPQLLPRFLLPHSFISPSSLHFCSIHEVRAQSHPSPGIWVW